MIDEKLLALLVKSRLFKPASDYAIDVKVNQLEKFQFWLPGCFPYGNDPDRKADQISCFEDGLKNFLKRYLQSWVNLLEQDPKNKSFHWIKYSTSLADFFSSFDAKKYFDQVASGKNTVTIHVTPNSSQLLIRRMGDILAFGVSKIGSEATEHVTGVRAVEVLCRTDDPHNNQGVYELVSDIQVSFQLPQKSTENGGMEGDVDFESISCMLKTTLPYVAWDFIPSVIVESYEEMDKDGIQIGEYFGLRINARLIHDGAKGKDDITDERFSYGPRAKIWRQGNVVQLSDTKYRFLEGENLLLVLTLKSSLPCSEYDEADALLKAHREQFLIASGGIILSTQLCSMMLNAYETQSIKLGN